MSRDFKVVMTIVLGFAVAVSVAMAGAAGFSYAKYKWTVAMQVPHVLMNVR